MWWVLHVPVTSWPAGIACAATCQGHGLRCASWCVPMHLKAGHRTHPAAADTAACRPDTRASMRSLTETQDADQLRRSLPDGAIMQYLTGGTEGGRGGSVSPTRQVAWARYSAVCSFLEQRTDWHACLPSTRT